MLEENARTRVCGKHIHELRLSSTALTRKVEREDYLASMPPQRGRYGADTESEASGDGMRSE